MNGPPLETAELSPEQVDIKGPLFLSYRQRDGSEIVTSLAWLLRAAGVPVWRDKDDLPPGDTADRLEQALADGLSGGVLTITPDIASSDIVRGIEAPALIRLHQVDSRFQLLIANGISSDQEDMDYGAPDRLLGRVRKELVGVNQVGTHAGELLNLVRAAVSHRMSQHRPLVAANGHFDLTVQTRNAGQVYDRTGAQLDIRLRRSEHERLPSGKGLEDLRKTLQLLPDAVVTAGGREVQLRGGAHLTVAFAIGAALPSSRIGTVTVVDQRNVSWRSGDESSVPREPQLAFEVNEAVDYAPDGRARVAVYLDLLPDRSDAAFDRFVAAGAGVFAAHATIRTNSGELLSPHEAGTIAAESVARIRQLSATYSNAAVDLLLRCPFPIAVLVGRLCNTMRVRLYEWDDSEHDGDLLPRYVAAMDVHASAPRGPITAVLLDDREHDDGPRG